MNPSMHSLAGLLVALFCSLAWVEPTQAQQGGRGYDHQDSRLDVDFPGGTLTDYVASIRRARPDIAANIVVMPKAKTLVVPPVKLVGVTVEAAVQILEGPYELDDGRVAEVDVHSYQVGDTPDVVMKVVAQYEPTMIRSSVWSVAEALASGQTAEELLGAIEAIRSLFAHPAEVSYHPPTGLLIARGTDEQLDLVRETIEQLVHSAERRQDVLASIAQEVDELEGELHRVSAHLRVTQQTIELAKTRHKVTMQAREQGNAPPEEVAEARLDVTRAEAELDIESDERRRIERRLEALHIARAKWDRPRP